MAALYLTAIGAFALAFLGLWDSLGALTRRAAWPAQHHALATPSVAAHEAGTVLQRAKHLPLAGASRRKPAEPSHDGVVELTA